METAKKLTSATKVRRVRKTGAKLPTLFTLSKPLDIAPGGGGGGATDGVAITSYGQGQVTGASYTCPAHSELTVDIDFQLMCVTSADVTNLNSLIRGMLDASQYSHFDELSKTDVSGGLSFFGFFSGGISASYSDTKHTMSGFGLSEANQTTIINAMAATVQQMNHFKVSGPVYNQDYDYSVTGSIYAIVMDATIQQADGSVQSRKFIAPNTHLQSSSGETLPVGPPLY
jgi:hypothetical protein